MLLLPYQTLTLLGETSLNELNCWFSHLRHQKSSEKRFNKLSKKMEKDKWSRWSLQLFVREKFHTHFESFVWGHHVGFLLRDTNMVTEKR